MRKIALGCLVVLIIFPGCQQELVFENGECRITMAHYYGGGGMHDSARFTYDAQGRLSRWTNMDGRYDYYYNGFNIIARKYTENSGLLWYVDSITYNPDNSVSTISFWDYSGTYSPDTLHTKIIYHYLSGRLNNLETVEYYDYGFGPETDTMFSSLSWNSAGNIEKMVHHSSSPYGFLDSILYQYDTNPNYLQAIHPHFYLLDPQFELHAGFTPHLAYVYSRNNVSNFNVYGTWDYPLVYRIDSLNNLSSIDMGGFPYMEYEFECSSIPAKRR